MVWNQAPRVRVPRRFSLDSVLGLVLTSLGLMVMSGWLLQVRGMVEIRSGFVAMTFNTALCFTVSGLALAVPALLQRPLRALRLVTGLFLLVLGALILTEHVLDRSLGVDWAFLHIWLLDGNTRPGRLAPNTAIGFMLAGGCLLLLLEIDRRWREMLFQVLVFCLLAVGLTGLIGYVLSPDQLFGWARSARMAVHTAVGMILLAVGLWANWHQGASLRGRSFLSPDEKIGFMSAAILCVTTLAAGLTGFVFQQAILEDALREKLQFQLKGQLSLIQAGLTQGMTTVERMSNDERLLEPAARLADAPANAAAQAAVQRELQGMIHNGFRSAALLAPDGRPLQTAGDPDPATQPETSVLRFNGAPGHDTALLWNGQLRQYSNVALHRNGTTIGRLIVSRHLPVLQATLFDLRGLGRTGELALCAGQEQKLLCLPTGRQKNPYLIARTNIIGRQLPMSLAISGQTGLIATFDYRGNNVMAAYAPIAGNVGLVVKQDTAELYAVIRTQLKFVIPALFLLLLLGTILMRSQVKPLAVRLRMSETQAREQRLEINTVLNSVGEGIITINEAGNIESFNAAAASIFGYAATEVTGQPLYMLMPPDMRAAHDAGLRRYLETGEARVIGRPKLEMPGLRKDGTAFTLELTVNEIRFDARRIFVGVVRDITERKQFEEKLIFLAQYDVLTGLPNRALFMDRLSGAMLRASRNRSAVAVMYLDLDGFKDINDSLGHHSGDELLRQFGDRLCMAVRKSDSVARLAGDEFTIILEGLRNPADDSRDVAEKIIAAMETQFDLGEHRVRITTSIGLAIHDAGEVDLETLLRRADDAMYRAKQSGKNRWCL